MKIDIKEIGNAIVNKVMSNEEERAKDRLSVCNGCPFNAGGICSSCGCLISLKVYSDSNNCPEKKWKE